MKTFKIYELVGLTLIIFFSLLFLPCFLNFAKVVNFLLSDFSEAVTGEIIHADGGVHSIGGSMLPR